MPVVNDYTALLELPEFSPGSWNAYIGTGKPVFVTYSFTDSADLPPPPDGMTFEAFSAEVRQTFRNALKEFERVSGIKFVEVTGPAMINAFGQHGGAEASWANFPYSTADQTNGSNLVMGLDGSETTGPHTTQLMWHEIGHALGLKHPFDGTITLDPNLDNTNNTVMSYTYLTWSVTHLGSLDLQALRHLYGNVANTTGWHWGVVNSVFTVTGAALNDVIIGVMGNNKLVGGLGNDQLFGREGQDSLIGGLGNDKLSGWAGHDTLHGGDGRDSLSGGAGNDLVYGGDLADTLLGDAGDDRLNGGEGYDKLFGGVGNDLLYGADHGGNLSGGSGDDRLYGGAGRDILAGDEGNDVLVGGQFADTMSGGTGDDRLFGHYGNDLIAGNHGNDRLDGGNGADTIEGGFGADSLTGGAGSDVFVFTQLDFFDGDFEAGQVNVITDFANGFDKIAMDARLEYSFASATISAIGHDVKVEFGGGFGVTILLKNVNLSDIDASDFSFDQIFG